jgi:hypothetical protein
MHAVGDADHQHFKVTPSLVIHPARHVDDDVVVQLDFFKRASRRTKGRLFMEARMVERASREQDHAEVLAGSFVDGGVDELGLSGRQLEYLEGGPVYTIG